MDGGMQKKCEEWRIKKYCICESRDENADRHYSTHFGVVNKKIPHTRGFPRGY